MHRRGHGAAGNDPPSPELPFVSLCSGRSKSPPARAGASSAAPKPGRCTNTLLIPQPEKGTWGFTGDAGPGHSSFRRNTLAGAVSPSMSPTLALEVLPTSKTTTLADSCHWDQLGGTGISPGRDRPSRQSCCARAWAARPTITAPPSHRPPRRPTGLGGRQRRPFGDTGLTCHPSQPPPGSRHALHRRGEESSEKQTQRSSGMSCVSPGAALTLLSLLRGTARHWRWYPHSTRAFPRRPKQRCRSSRPAAPAPREWPGVKNPINKPVPHLPAWRGTGTQ